MYKRLLIIFAMIVTLSANLFADSGPDINAGVVNANCTVDVLGAGHDHGTVWYTAQWVRKKHNVDYNCDSNDTSSVTPGSSVEEYDAVVTLVTGSNNTCKKTNYEFKGWNCDGRTSGDSLNIVDNKFNMPDEDVLCTASWDIVWCGENLYLDNNTCKNCPPEFPNSAPGSTNENQCYKPCEKTCTQGECPANAVSCTYGSNTTNGIQYINQTCDATDPGTCPITDVVCMDEYYKKDSNTCEQIKVTTPTNHLTYNGAAQMCPGITVIEPDGNNTVKYGVNETAFNADNPHSITDVGNTTVYYKVTTASGNTKTGSYICYMDPTGMNPVPTGNTKTYDGTVLNCDGGTWTGVPNGSSIMYSTTDGTGYSSTVPTRTNAGSTTIYYKITNPNYNDFTGHFDCVVNKADCTVSLESGAGDTIYPNNSTVRVTSSSRGELSVVSDTPEIATSRIDNGTVTMTPLKYGVATIKVISAETSNYNSCFNTYTLNVNRGTCRIAVNPTSTVIAYPNTKDVFDIDWGECNGERSISSNSEDVVTARWKNNDKIPGEVTFVHSGETVVTVRSAQSDQYNESSADFNVITKQGVITAVSSNNIKIYDGNALMCNGNIEVSEPVSGAVIKYSTSENGTYTTTVPSIINVNDSKTIYYQITATNYETLKGSFGCGIMPADCTVTLSESSGTLTYPTPNANFTVNTNSDGAIRVNSNATDIATVSFENDTVTMTPLKQGVATITANVAATSNYKTCSATYTLNVQNKVVIIDKNGGIGTCAGAESDDPGKVICSYDNNRCIAPSWNATTCNITKENGTLIKWNTVADGSGTDVSFGDNIENIGDTLYAQWAECQCSNGSGAENCTATNATGNKCKFKWNCADGYYNSVQNIEILGMTYTATCNTCPDEYNDGSDGERTSKTNCYTQRTPICNQNNGDIPQNCSSVISWNACECAGEKYKVYSNENGDGDGRIYGNTTENCTKVAERVTAESGSYTIGAICRPCTTYGNGTYTMSAGGEITADGCYKEVEPICIMNECSVPDNCQSATCSASCNCAGVPYRQYADESIVGNTEEYCTKDVVSVTAAENYYANGTMCTKCPDEWAFSAAGNSGGCSACYTNATRQCIQNKCINPDPARCYKATCKSSCECTGETYVQYANNTCDGNGLTSGQTTESCTKDVEQLFAYYGYRPNGVTSCLADIYNIEYITNGGHFDQDIEEFETYTIESNGVILPTPVRNDYEFIGWCDDDALSQNCSINRNIPRNSTGDRVFYAKWNFVCESNKWLHINDEKVCLYSEPNSYPAIKINLKDAPYYVNLSENPETPIHHGSRKKMHVNMNNTIFNVYDNSVM